MSPIVRLCCALAALTLGAALYTNTVVSSAGSRPHGPGSPADSNAAAYAVAAAATPTPSPIVVNSLSDAAANDGLCTLREAITSANTDAPSGAASGECAAGVGNDTVSFSVTGTINLTGVLPDLSSNITINGPAANLLTVRRDTGGSYRVLNVTTGATVAVSGLTVSGGSPGSTLTGGGIRNAGTLSLTGTAVSGNSAWRGGGISNHGTLAVTNSAVSDNVGGFDGGGGIFNGGTLSLVNSTVSNNDGGGGGGGVYNLGVLDVANSTLSSNFQSGITNFGVTATIANTISTNNNPVDLNGTITSNGFNLIRTRGIATIIEAQNAGTNIYGQDPKLGVLADNGGPTRTHALPPDSPAIDRGKNFAADSVGNPLLTDQRGLTRPFDQSAVANAAGGDGSDIGAYEVSSTLQTGGPSFVVNTTNDHDGSCTVAECSLREAVNSANAHAGADSITFAPALTSGGAVTVNLTGVLPDIVSSMNVNGPGASLLTVRRDTGGVYRIFNIPAAAATVTISGLTVTNGLTANGLEGSTIGGRGGDGGAVLNSGALTLTDVVVTGNTTGNGGNVIGGISNFGGPGGFGGGIFSTGTLTMTNVTVSNNTTGCGGTGIFAGSGGRGGGIYSNGGALTLTNVQIVNNRTGNGANGLSGGASGGGGGDGGGVILNAGSLSATNVNISGNVTGDAGNGGSAGYGGGLFTNTGLQATLVDTAVSNNTTGNGGGGTAGTGGLGGGIMNHGIMTAARVTVGGNTTGIAGSTGGFRGGSGGGIFNNAALTMTDSTVSGNTTRGNLADGGGIYSQGNLLSLTNCTISNNRANPSNDSTGGRGGGLYTDGLASALTNVTVTGNSAYTCCRFRNGQGVHNSGTLSVRNTIIAGNGNGGAPDVTGNFNSQGNNLVGRATAGTNNGGDADQSGFTNGVNGDIVGTMTSPVNARLSALGSYGGPTQTHAPLPASPAIDAGSSTGAPATDQRGVGRTGTTDIGAFESRGFNVSAAAGTPQGATINTAFGMQLTAAVTSAFGEPTAGGLVTFGAPASGASATFSGPTTVAINSDGAATTPTFRANGTAGAYNVTASVTAPANSSPAAFALTNLKAATATALSSSSNPSAFGQPLTFTATVTSTAGTPTGNVLFRSNGADLGTAAVNAGGVATLTTSGLAAGAHAVTAEYGGDPNFNASGAALDAAQAVGSVVEFVRSSYDASEGAGVMVVNVRRSGDTSAAVEVDYATDDGSSPSVAVPCAAATGIALDRCDFTRALGTLHFGAGEAEKSFVVLISDDSYAEGPEAAMLKLSNPSAGAVVGARAAALLNITDDTPESNGNPIDDDETFVRQHYRDFLNREADASGLKFWTDGIKSCGADAACREVKRIDTSAAFFLSIEFQETGYLVYRTFKAALGDAASPNVAGTVPVVRLSEFLTDTQRIGRGVVVNSDGWERKLEENKQAYAAEFVGRSRFTSAFPLSVTADEFVTKLDQNAGGVLSADERAQLVASLGATPGDAAKRAQVLRAVAEHAALRQRETTRAFVLMQFYGYLRRDPDAAPDADFRGWQFWLSKLDEFGGDFRRAEMVKAFISSDEYRHRFGQ